MDQDYISQTALDQMTGSDYDQMLKAAIPYLPPNGRRVLSIYEKAKELRNTITLFNNPGAGLEMCAASAPASDPMEIINDIRSYCYGQSRRTLDKMVNMMAVIQMMQLMNQSSTSTEDSLQPDIKKEESHE